MSVAAGIDYTELPILIKYFDLISDVAWEDINEYVGGKMTTEFSSMLYNELENRSFWVKGCIDSTREVFNNGIEMVYSTKDELVSSITISTKTKTLFSADLT